MRGEGQRLHGRVGQAGAGERGVEHVADGAGGDLPGLGAAAPLEQQRGGWLGSVALADRGGRETGAMASSGSCSVFAGFRFPREVISVAVRWYLRYGLSYRDVEELLAERGITVDHVTVYRWVQRYTPEFIEAARLCRHAPGDRWFVDETYVKVSGRWTYLYRAKDQHGQVIDVLLSERRDLAAARRFFTGALRTGTIPAEVTTDRAPTYLRVLDELVPSALHIVERYASNPVETDHGRLKARLRPMRGLKRHRSARILAAGHTFVQNLRRGHYELATDVPARHRIRTAFDQLAMTI
jgi:IS6 family transposase